MVSPEYIYFLPTEAYNMLYPEMIAYLHDLSWLHPGKFLDYQSKNQSCHYVSMIEMCFALSNIFAWPAESEWSDHQ